MGIIERLKATRLTKTDIGYLVLKTIIAVLLCIFLTPIGGVIAYIMLSFSLEMIIVRFYKVEPFNSVDTNVFLDQISNRCHIMGILRTEKTNEDTFREIFQRRMTKRYSRFRSKVVKILDSYFF